MLFVLSNSRRNYACVSFCYHGLPAWSMLMSSTVTQVYLYSRNTNARPSTNEQPFFLLPYVLTWNNDIMNILTLGISSIQEILITLIVFIARV